MTGDAWRWLVFFVVAGSASGGLYYVYQDTRPCVHPVAYAVGAVDSRFDISRAAVIADAKASAAIWNTAAGKSVLVYDPEAKMKINFVYDEREENAKLGNEIARAQASGDAVKAAIDAAEAAFKSRQDAYNQEVQAINARGGATRGEQARLASERSELDALAASINQRVASYNASVKALNLKVAEFNKSAGRTFEEGQYVRDSSGTRINIFQFISTTQLRRVLAHEFGHAIGLGHNDDAKSIMYAQNESGNLAPTAADLSALRSLCGA